MGKKKDKLYKLEPETKAMIAAVRSAVEDCAATGLYGRFMGFEESHTTDDYRLTAVFDCGEYRLRLRYLPSVMLLTDNFLDIDLDYGDAGRFTLYDVFNVLEIEDFNQYYHSGFSTTGEVPGLVRELLEAVHKYDYDLRRAAEPQLLAQMKANRLADMKAVRGKSRRSWAYCLRTQWSPLCPAQRTAPNCCGTWKRRRLRADWTPFMNAACWTICAGAIRWWTKPSKPSRILSGSIGAVPAR